MSTSTERQEWYFRPMSKRNGIILALLFLIIVVEIIIMAPKELDVASEAPAAPSAKPSTKTTGQVMKDVYSIEAGKSGKEWELWADRALTPQAGQEWTIERVKVKFYAENGVIYNVTGDEGHVVRNEKGIRDIKINGHVVTRSSNGYVFKSETIFYTSEGPVKKLTSPSDVEMSAPPDKDGGELKLTGTELNADLITNEMTVNKNVKASKTVKGNKELKITSERARFSGRAKMAHFIGSVVLTYDTMTATGPEAKFAYGDGGQALDSVNLSGGARLTDANKFAVSQSVNVNFKNDEVVFKGSPRVTQNGDELIGDEIVFLENGKKVKVRNARAQLESDEDQVESENSK